MLSSPSRLVEMLYNRETGQVSWNGLKVLTCAFPEHMPGLPNVEGQAAMTYM